jgi:hypothetical protein
MLNITIFTRYIYLLGSAVLATLRISIIISRLLSLSLPIL